jgi:hypothetical protein
MTPGSGMKKQPFTVADYLLQELNKPIRQPSLVEVVIPEKDLPGQMRRLGEE